MLTSGTSSGGLASNRVSLFLGLPLSPLACKMGCAEGMLITDLRIITVNLPPTGTLLLAFNYWHSKFLYAARKLSLSFHDSSSGEERQQLRPDALHAYSTGVGFLRWAVGEADHNGLLTCLGGPGL
jgi:hypothetical protein